METERLVVQRQPGFRRTRGQGFSLLEALVAMTLLTIGLVSLAALVVSTSRQTELEEDRQRVLEAAQNLLEQVKATEPMVIEATYNAQQFPVPGVAGTVAVDIDATDPAILGVTVTAIWDTRDITHNLVLQTEIYNSKG